MLKSIAQKFFSTANDRNLKNFSLIIKTINDLEEDIIKLRDEDFPNETNKLKAELKTGKTLDDILPKAFALCREAAKRTVSMRHFDVQLLGGIALHKGMIAEMRTGEGKTLVCTLAAYLNALSEKPVHVVTVNDYLVKRDAEWMGQIYNFLGLSVGCVVSNISDADRKKAYQSDITYGTNNEFGFDYLRDNLRTSIKDMVQQELHYAILDEVDSILIDEARTPLIISGPARTTSQLYIRINQLIPKLTTEDYEIEEKSKSAFLTDSGIEKIEVLLREKKLIEEGSTLYDVENVNLVHHINQALKAHKLYKNEVDYIVREQKVEIIDEFTGRIMEGRRYSDGLHQAIEAKENVKIREENHTIASVTYQNYFRSFNKLAGMTGTATTEAAEFASTYNLEVASIPTNRNDGRIDHDDAVYKTANEKYKAILEQIELCQKKGQPVLLGTVSIEKSELLSKILKKANIKHQVLNAKHHEKEAHIIAQAGQKGAVTIATNMAGRGTDIMLGGNPEMLALDNKKETAEEIKLKVEKQKEEVLKAGGLFVIGSERHESRRIDNQLRGRSARQGDPGETKFFLSLEDDLMRIFGSDKITAVMNKLGFEEGESIEHPWISKALERAQKKVEAHNFEVRKSLIKFDDVLNEQRKAIYKKRKEIMKQDDFLADIKQIVEDTNEELVIKHIPAKSYFENWQLDELDAELNEIYNHEFNIKEFAKQDGISETEILDEIDKQVESLIDAKKQRYSQKIMNILLKNIMLMMLDSNWREHLATVDNLKTSIGLRAYGQKDPLSEYKHECFNLYQTMQDRINKSVLANFIRAEVNFEAQDKMEHDEFYKDDSPHQEKHASASKEAIDPYKNIGRNELCPCGSKKKFKQCHGKII